MNVARILFAAKATERPAARGRLLARLLPLAPFGGGPAQFRVTGQKVVDGRLYVRVQLPRRPNFTQGWIEADDAQLSRTDYAVAIDTAARRVTVSLRRRRVKTFPAVVGRPDSPTPRGTFAITELVQQFPASRFLGAWVLPLTAYSGTYTEFQGGPGLVAIHGRAGDSLLDPLGSAASHGCIRIDNRAVDWMAAHLEPGVPVTVR
jgi:lipoprotein-anchoring transpeptidase ErfK/SrfK